jgi:hypothetical protein
MSLLMYHHIYSVYLVALKWLLPLYVQMEKLYDFSAMTCVVIRCTHATIMYNALSWRKNVIFSDHCYFSNIFMYISLPGFATGNVN